MDAEHPDKKTIFNEAAEIESPQDRKAYLEKACGGDAELRAAVEELLRLHESNRRFMAVPVLGPRDTVHLIPPTEKPGDVIGCYKLLEKIGEGGFGVVYMAQQQAPVRRRVALKVIKLGMDTKAVVARFEAERQALALLDHANIAQVFDAGTTEAGRPYFVMEYVKGVPLTEHCDRQKLSIEERLGLFLLVCEGVQHAHQKGIIHRDIKPSNILVSIEGEKAVPKIIDFGVAKAIAQPLTERTLFTEQGQLIGTPEYMSPEQAEMTAQDIDTRTDIYSLGV
ncbi:MAG: serine/threonine protein kinase, partial [Candidatus Brocadiae bacterium]|nr:serine/threonine protein kinase [Candidatus Brocadiia bacterium]